MSWQRLFLRLTVRCVANPGIVRDLVVVAWRFRDRRWLLRVPFLPLPAMDYVRWRMHTAYGDHAAVPPVHAVVGYVRWARRANGIG